MAIESGRVLNERYRLIRPLGQGSQAAVWVAEHLALTTQVAVKLIDPELAKKEDARVRFRREATAAAQLRSAHVVQILDHGIDDTQAFIVMELLEGEDLFERIQKRGQVSLAETSKIVTQVARALTRAHGAGIVHRDLKPENVFIVANEDDEIVKVLDFGVAKVIDPAKRTMQRTGIGTLIGTPHYMSPEQVKGIAEVDFKSDLWSLGVIAYQCVTGELPFDSEGVGDLLLKITIGDVPVPSALVPSLPPSFDAWFARACDREPSKRFESAREMADALARVVGVAADEGESTRYRFGPALAKAKVGAPRSSAARIPTPPVPLVARPKSTSNPDGADAEEKHEDVTDVDDAAPVAESHGRPSLESTDIDVEESLGSMHPPAPRAHASPLPRGREPAERTEGQVGGALRDAATRSVPRSTVSGLSSPGFGSVSPPEFDAASRRRRMIGLVAIGFIAVAGVVGYRVVQPYLAPAAPGPEPRETASAVPAPLPPAVAASEAGKAVDPGKPADSGKARPPTTDPARSASSARNKPPPRDKKGRPIKEPVIQYDTPGDEEAPAPPPPKQPAPPPAHGTEPDAPPAGI